MGFVAFVAVAIGAYDEAKRCSKLAHDLIIRSLHPMDAVLAANDLASMLEIDIYLFLIQRASIDRINRLFEKIDINNVFTHASTPPAFQLDRADRSIPPLRYHLQGFGVFLARS